MLQDFYQVGWKKFKYQYKKSSQTEGSVWKLNKNMGMTRTLMSNLPQTTKSMTQMIFLSQWFNGSVFFCRIWGLVADSGPGRTIPYLHVIDTHTIPFVFTPVLLLGWRVNMCPI